MSTLSYAEAVAELQRRGRFGIRLGLSRTKALLRGLGDPHRSIRGALVAGTNGKGSVLALTASACRSAAGRSRPTTSPASSQMRCQSPIGLRAATVTRPSSNC